MPRRKIQELHSKTMTILNIETSTTCCSASISIDGVSVASRANLAGANHASELPVFIDDLLRQAKEQHWVLDAVALSQGPGSYTGLRIGASIAKGICYGLNIPLIPVDTLQVLCACAQALAPELLQPGALLCPMLDARRMEVYTALYEVQGNAACLRLNNVQALIIDQNAFADQLSQRPVYFFGNGAGKCQSVISSMNAHFIDGVQLSAQHMGHIAEQQAAIDMLDIKRVAYYEPFYLKEFVAAPSHIKGLD